MIYVTDQVIMPPLPFSHGMQIECFANETLLLCRYENVSSEVAALGVQSINAFKVVWRAVAAGGAVDVR